MTMIIGCKGESDNKTPPPPKSPATVQSTDTGTAATTRAATAPAPLKIAAPTITPLNTASEQMVAERLVGNWVADGTDAPLGMMQISLEFKVLPNQRTLTWTETPLIGEGRSKTATYEVQGEWIRSRAIMGDNAVSFEFKGAKLEIRFSDGRVIRFHQSK